MLRNVASGKQSRTFCSSRAVTEGFKVLASGVCIVCSSNCICVSMIVLFEREKVGTFVMEIENVDHRRRELIGTPTELGLARRENRGGFASTRSRDFTW